LSIFAYRVDIVYARTTAAPCDQLASEDVVCHNEDLDPRGPNSDVTVGENEIGSGPAAIFCAYGERYDKGLWTYSSCTYDAFYYRTSQCENDTTVSFSGYVAPPNIVSNQSDCVYDPDTNMYCAQGCVTYNKNYRYYDTRVRIEDMDPEGNCLGPDHYHYDDHAGAWDTATSRNTTYHYWETWGEGEVCGGSGIAPPETGDTCVPNNPVACQESEAPGHDDTLRYSWYSGNGYGTANTCNGCDPATGNPLTPGDPYCNLLSQGYVNEISATTVKDLIETSDYGNFCYEGTIVWEGSITLTESGSWSFRYEADAGSDFDFFINTGAGLQEVLSNSGGNAPADGNDLDFSQNYNPNSTGPGVGRDSGCAGSEGDRVGNEVCHNSADGSRLCDSVGEGIDHDGPENGVYVADEDGDGTTYCNWMKQYDGNWVPVNNLEFKETRLTLNAGTYPIKVVYKVSPLAFHAKLLWIPPSGNVCWRNSSNIYNLNENTPPYPTKSCSSDADCSIDNQCRRSSGTPGEYKCWSTTTDCGTDESVCQDSNDACGYNPATCIWGSCAQPTNPTWQTIPSTAFSPTPAASCPCDNDDASCTVSIASGDDNQPAGSEITVNVTGNYTADPTAPVQVYVSKAPIGASTTGVQVKKSDGVTWKNALPLGPYYDGKYYYQISTTDVTPCYANGSPCSFTIKAPANDYLVMCNVLNPPTAPSGCTGDPFININGGDVANSGNWANCGGTINERGGDNQAFCTDNTNVATAECVCAAGTCTKTITHTCPTPTSETIACEARISGYVYDVTGKVPMCLDTSTPLNPASVHVTGTVNDTNAVGADGSYQFTTDGDSLDIPGSYQVSVAPPNSEYSLVCSSGPYPVPVILDGGDADTIVGGVWYYDRPPLNFRFAIFNDPWFQVIGGNVLAEGKLEMKIPADLFASMKDLSDRSNSSGFPVIKVGASYAIDGEFGVEHADVYGAQTRAAIPEDYSYFYSIYGMPQTPLNDLTGTNISSEFTSTPVNLGREAYYIPDDVVLTASDWTIEAGESKVIFVNGDLRIERGITVAVGGFLAFIVNGDITFDDSLKSSSDSTTPIIEGVFVANGKIIIESDTSSEEKFVGAGAFIGWRGFELPRDYSNNGTSDNTLYPTELFIARPDFVFNIPERMKKPMYDWFETAP